MNANARGFLSLVTTRKGDYAEDILLKMMRDGGCNVYRPSEKDRSHPIDMFVVPGETMRMFAADVKAKPKRSKYPDTGIDIRHWGKYCHINTYQHTPVFLFFVDEDCGKIYGNWLEILNKPVTVNHNNGAIDYPKLEGNIIYFPMQSMIPIGDISKEDIEKLRSLSSRGYQYQHIQQNEIAYTEAACPSSNSTSFDRYRDDALAVGSSGDTRMGGGVMLPYDITRCLGEMGIWDRCAKREQCQRYTDQGQPGDRLVYAMVLCRHNRFEAWIPVDG